jgi:hypothetical protein
MMPQLRVRRALDSTAGFTFLLSSLKAALGAALSLALALALPAAASTAGASLAAAPGKAATSTGQRDSIANHA